MMAFPHSYQVRVDAASTGNLNTHADQLPVLSVASPRQFDGPGDQWSPEDLLIASAANCLVLTFRAIAQASKLNWESMECDTTGELDRIDGITRFTRLSSHVRLRIAAGENREKAEKLLEKAEKACLITNSLSCESSMSCEVEQP